MKYLQLYENFNKELNSYTIKYNELKKVHEEKLGEIKKEMLTEIKNCFKNGITHLMFPEYSATITSEYEGDAEYDIINYHDIIYAFLDDDSVEVNVYERGGGEYYDYGLNWQPPKELLDVYYYVSRLDVYDSISEAIKRDCVEVFSHNYKFVNLNDVEIYSNIPYTESQYSKIEHQGNIILVCSKCECKEIKKFMKEYEFQKHILLKYPSLVNSLFTYAGENEELKKEYEEKYGQQLKMDFDKNQTKLKL